MGRLTFQIPNEQHREWIIASFFIHIHCSLTQQKVTSQPKELEIVMKLEASTIGYGIGMTHV
jgi:hypothetical protein